MSIHTHIEDEFKQYCRQLLHLDACVFGDALCDVVKWGSTVCQFPIIFDHFFYFILMHDGHVHFFRVGITHYKKQRSRGSLFA